MQMPLVVRQMLASEKFVWVSVLFMLPLTIFAIMSKITIDEWRHDALWALGFLVGGKTIQGAAEKLGTGRAPREPAHPHAKREPPEPPPLPRPPTV